MMNLVEVDDELVGTTRHFRIDTGDKDCAGFGYSFLIVAELAIPVGTPTQILRRMTSVPRENHTRLRCMHKSIK